MNNMNMGVDLQQSASGDSTRDLSCGNEAQGSSPEEDKAISLRTPTGRLNSVGERSNSVNSNFNTSRSNSIYSLSRTSFSDQLSRLKSFHLPQVSTFSSSISSIPAAPVAAEALSAAAEQIQRWSQKASEVLGGLDAEDDVEWAAAGGREGVGELDRAIGRFEDLIQAYVAAIEDLYPRHDISDVSKGRLEAVVDQMEAILKDWNNIRLSLKSVKRQVELAMEWQELWEVVLGDIGLEMEELARLIFEMEEKRHTTQARVTSDDLNGGLDIQELETIMEETPTRAKSSTDHRFSLPPAFATTSPHDLVGTSHAQDDSSLLALFARMQPLRASLDFLPMRLSTYRDRAEPVLPSACTELESKRTRLEEEWKRLNSDAERLRRELGEDRWIMVFRNAGRQAQKMCESVQRSIDKVQESLDSDAQYSNVPMLAKKVENYEAKKMHYGPAIQRVLAIIEKGVKDRLTVNGEILRLHSDTQAGWSSLQAEMQGVDAALEDRNANQNQQLRDSISSIISIDRSAIGSATDTPGSSPASSVVMGPSNAIKTDVSMAGMTSGARRGSSQSSKTSHPSRSTTSHQSTTKRHFSMSLASPISSQLPRKSMTPRSTTPALVRGISPIPGSKSAVSTTPSPSNRPPRPSMLSSDGKPRWNSSPKVDYTQLGHNFKPLSLTASSPHSKQAQVSRTPRSAPLHFSKPQGSPLCRETSSSPAPQRGLLGRPRMLSGVQSSLAVRSVSNIESPRIRPSKQQQSVVYLPPTTKQQSQPPQKKKAFADIEPIVGDSPYKNARPATAMGSTKRLSMLPLPKDRLQSGRESVAGMLPSGRESAM